MVPATQKVGMAKHGIQKRATIHDVARMADVSSATVSKVLRGFATVKAENSLRVHEAVRKLGYRMDPLASGLRQEQRRIIGAVLPDLQSAFFGALASGLERASEAAGYTMIIASSRECEEREADLVARMNDWRVAGTILAPVRSERGAGATALRTLDMCAVLVDRVSTDERFDTVTADNFKASANVADFLLGAGHSHILLHGATHISKAVRTRVEGFSTRARALQPPVRIDTLLSDDDLETQKHAIRDYFDGRSSKERPTAVFSLSQYSTLLVLSELRRQGIRIPDHIALVGFDDVDWMEAAWPSITAVAQPVEALAARAIATLLTRIEGKGTDFSIQYLEPCELRIRQSAVPREKIPRPIVRGG